MKRRSLLIGFCALLIIVAGLWGMLRARAFSSGHQPAVQRPTTTATVSSSLYLTGSRPIPTVAVPSSATNCEPKNIPGVSSDPAGGIGSHAIKPHLCGIPTFTTEDVRQYMSTVSSFTSFRIVQTSSHFTVTRILFVTNSVANNILNADTGVMSDKLIVCYVEVYGDFTVSSPFPTKNSKPAIYHHGQMVFDGVTGNMLVIGVE